MSKRKQQEIRLIFNEDERIDYDGDLNFNIRTFRLDFNDIDTSILINDCKSAFNCRNIEKDQSYSSGHTFFLRSDETPRCVLEQLAMTIFSKHTESARFDKSNSGCEWWTQVIDSEDDIGFHFDADYGLESQCDTFIHPHIATVTYLSDIGAPTVILDCACYGDGDDRSPILEKENEIHVCHPSFGKHLSFDGKLLHGSPSELCADRDGENRQERITFLVNIWLNHIPIESDRISKKYLKQMNTDVVLNTSVQVIEDPIPTIIYSPSSVKGNLSLRFPSGESNFSLVIPRLTADFTKHLQSSSSANAACLKYEEHAVKIEKCSKKKRVKRK